MRLLATINLLKAILIKNLINVIDYKWLFSQYYSWYLCSFFSLIRLCSVRINMIEIIIVPFCDRFLFLSFSLLIIDFPWLLRILITCLYSFHCFCLIQIDNSGCICYFLFVKSILLFFVFNCYLALYLELFHFLFHLFFLRFSLCGHLYSRFLDHHFLKI
jgi:hypothetical protein